MTNTKVVLLILVAPFITTCVFMAGRASVDSSPSNARATPVPRALPIGVTKFHDASDEVTCWLDSASLSCLPDQVLASARHAGGQP